MATWLYRIGEAAARRAWVVILIWALIIAGVAGAYTAFHGKLSNTFSIPGTQTQQLSDELAQRFPSANRGSGQIILTTGDGAALTEEQKQAFSAALSALPSEVPSVDAFIVRMTLTPAIMALLGDKAWWMPKWLDRLTPNMDVEGAALSEKMSEEMSEKVQHERESTATDSGNKLG